MSTVFINGIRLCASLFLFVYDDFDVHVQYRYITLISVCMRGIKSSQPVNAGICRLQQAFNFDALESSICSISAEPLLAQNNEQLPVLKY